MDFLSFSYVMKNVYTFLTIKLTKIAKITSCVPLKITHKNISNLPYLSKLKTLLLCLLPTLLTDNGYHDFFDY